MPLLGKSQNDLSVQQLDLNLITAIPVLSDDFFFMTNLYIKWSNRVNWNNVKYYDRHTCTAHSPATRFENSLGLSRSQLSLRQKNSRICGTGTTPSPLLLWLEKNEFKSPALKIKWSYLTEKGLKKGQTIGQFRILSITLHYITLHYWTMHWNEVKAERQLASPPCLFQVNCEKN